MTDIQARFPEALKLDAPFILENDVQRVAPGGASDADSDAADAGDEDANQSPFNPASMRHVFAKRRLRLEGYRAAQNLLRHDLSWTPTRGVPLRLISIQGLMEAHYQDRIHIRVWFCRCCHQSAPEDAVGIICFLILTTSKYCYLVRNQLSLVLAWGRLMLPLNRHHRHHDHHHPHHHAGADALGP